MFLNLTNVQTLGRTARHAADSNYRHKMHVTECFISVSSSDDHLCKSVHSLPEMSRRCFSLSISIHILITDDRRLQITTFQKPPKISHRQTHMGIIIMSDAKLRTFTSHRHVTITNLPLRRSMRHAEKYVCSIHFFETTSSLSDACSNCGLSPPLKVRSSCCLMNLQLSP